MGRGPEIGFQNVTLAVPVEEIAVDNAITSSEAEIVCTESEIISRDPEIISTPLNVEISAEQVIVPVEQEALNQSQLSRPLLQQFLLLVVFCLHDQIPKMKKMQSHQEQLDVEQNGNKGWDLTNSGTKTEIKTHLVETVKLLDIKMKGIILSSTHRVDRRRRRRPTPFQMASVQFAEIEQRRLDLEERRLEVDRLREYRSK
ncbi:hypothetical protein EVAR_29559_1 [Eumeta japonica]|uniref:Uncharacterized protein n=1 Tax=Eumeta variegata TaxID=151549 RepID=A0A4C1ZZW3_EUMVA|nr:hypothetical protein EVAR_29559_1 [Eumeta japonica]